MIATLVPLVIGNGLTLQHYRPNPVCGVLEELEPIEQNLQYDFDYQQTVHLPAEVTLLPVRKFSWYIIYRSTSSASTGK